MAVQAYERAKQVAEAEEAAAEAAEDRSKLCGFWGKNQWKTTENHGKNKGKPKMYMFFCFGEHFFDLFVSFWTIFGLNNGCLCFVLCLRVRMTVCFGV